MQRTISKQTATNIKAATKGLVNYDDKRSALTLGGRVVENIFQQPIQEAELRELLGLDQIKRFEIEKHDQSYILMLHFSGTIIPLQTPTSKAKEFFTVDEILLLLKSLNVNSITLNPIQL